MVQTDSTSRFTVLLPIEQEGWHRTIAGLLEPQGVHTVLAHSGREALDLIEKTPLHAAVLDLQMPGLGGLQILKLMRELGKTVPSVLLAENLSNYLLREALGMHVFSVLSKPVDFNLLLDALARILRRYHENRWPGAGEGLNINQPGGQTSVPPATDNGQRTTDHKHQTVGFKS